MKIQSSRWFVCSSRGQAPHYATMPPEVGVPPPTSRGRASQFLDIDCRLAVAGAKTAAQIKVSLQWKVRKCGRLLWLCPGSTVGSLHISHLTHTAWWSYGPLIDNNIFKHLPHSLELETKLREDWSFIQSRRRLLLGLVDAFYFKTLLLFRLIIEKDSRIVGTQGPQ